MPNGYQGPETHNERALERQLSLANDRIRELEAERDNKHNDAGLARVRLDKALAALREIEAEEHKPGARCAPIARAAIAEIEGKA